MFIRLRQFRLRQFEIRDRDFHDLPVHDRILLVVRAVVHRQRGIGILPEKPGPFVVRIGLQQAVEAVGGFVVLVVIFVKDAEIVNCTAGHRRMLEAFLVIADRLLVVAFEVVQERESEQGTGMRGIEFDCPFVRLRGFDFIPIAFREAAFLEVILGVVRGHVLDLGQDIAGFAGMPLEAEQTCPLQMHLLGGVARFLGLIERLHGLVVLAAVRVRPAEEERRQRAFRGFEVFDGRRHMPEEKLGNAQFELDFLLLRPGRHAEPFRQNFADFLQGAHLRRPLGEPFPQFGHHAAFKIFALD
jgi:hypothetical protein